MSCECVHRGRGYIHFAFGVALVVKSCFLYIFADEQIKLAIRDDYKDVTVMDSLNMRTFWILASSFIGVGVALDLVTLFSSLFWRRVALAFLSTSMLVHLIAILPQQVTGLYVALSMQDKCTMTLNSTVIHSPTTTIQCSDEIAAQTYRVLLAFSSSLLVLEVCAYVNAVLFFLFLAILPPPASNTASSRTGSKPTSPLSKKAT